MVQVTETADRTSPQFYLSVLYTAICLNLMQYVHLENWYRRIIRLIIGLFCEQNQALILLEGSLNS